MSDNAKAVTAIVFVLLAYGVVGSLDYKEAQQQASVTLVCNRHAEEESRGGAHVPRGHAKPIVATADRTRTLIESDPMPVVYRCVVRH
jgi:hypothetical protein